MIPRDVRREPKRLTRVTCGIVAMAFFAWSGLLCMADSSVQLGDVIIRLHSVKYFRGGDYTRFVYQAIGPTAPSCPFWVLGLCPSAALATWWTSTEMSWIEQPLAGVRFTPSLRNEKFYLYLHGAWGVADTAVGALVRDAAGERFAVGEIDGPACGGSSLSLEVLTGALVSFPAITGAGVFPASGGTTLRVVSSASGWALTWSRSLFVPEGADEVVVDRVFDVSVGAFAAAAGSTDVPVAYALRVSESDLAGLPEGTYDVSIIYTVVLD